jgi:hypothetical protein
MFKAFCVALFPFVSSGYCVVGEAAIGPFLRRRPFAFVSVMKGKAAAPLAKPRGS